ncbi:MAG: carboxypeptidase-like regulatory domain-containing protein, partial [Thermoanaerobaculia bacterium]
MRKAALLLATLLLPSTAGGQDWRGPVALQVQVEDAKGRNLGDAEVLLVYLSPEGGGSLPSVLTDASGNANIGGLAAGRWSAEVRHAGHMSY